MNTLEFLGVLKKYHHFLFGSRAWSNAFTTESDYDYVLPLAEANELKTILISKGIAVSNNDYYVSGYYFNTTEGCKINITGCKVNDFEAWRLATKMVICTKEYISLKKNHHMLFESTLALLKQML